jgi:hypothetical protein
VSAPAPRHNSNARAAARSAPGEAQPLYWPNARHQRCLEAKLRIVALRALGKGLQEFDSASHTQHLAIFGAVAGDLSEATVRMTIMIMCSSTILRGAGMANSDTWIDFGDSRSDWLGRLPAVNALQRMLDSPSLSTPMVLGVYGGWGTGKTSVMRTLESRLKRSDRMLVWFESWVYARQDEALWRALLLCVIEALRVRTRHPDELSLQGKEYDKAKKAFDTMWLSPDDARNAAFELDEASASLYRSLAFSEKGGVRFNWSGALPLAADAALTAITAGLSTQIASAVAGKDGPTGPVAAVAKWLKGGDTKEMVKLFEREATERYVEHVTSLEQFQVTFRRLLGRFRIGTEDRRLFLFVDDLDRCLPDNAVAALEAIKLFLDLPGCVFILGMDRSVVEQGISVRYSELKEAGFDARAYLDKIIQIPFNLPPLGRQQVDKYLESISGQTGISKCRDLIRIAAPPNPRTLKRVLNSLLLTLYLDGYDDEKLGKLDGAELARARRLAKLVLLQVCFEPVWRQVVGGGPSLSEIERSFKQADYKLGEGAKEVIREAGDGLEALFRTDPLFTGLDENEVESLLAVSKAIAPDLANYEKSSQSD